MAGLRDQFRHYYLPDDEEVAAALRTGLVALDANVLLNLYRFQPLARDELFLVLERLGQRLWIPHQVALEFHRNRLGVIAEQERLFATVQGDLDGFLKGYLERLKGFGNRISLPRAEVARLEEHLSTAHAGVCGAIATAEAANEVRLADHASDPVLARLDTLLEDRVGEPLAADDLEAARKEAQRRVEAKIPPGYQDRGKDDPSGDYVFWKQLKDEAARRRVPTILVTDDQKPDWVRRDRGQTLGPRMELRAEMAADAGVPFLMMTAATFLRRAKEYLSVPVSAETVTQAKDLPESLQKAAEDTADHEDDFARPADSTARERINDATARLRELSAFRDYLELAIAEAKASDEAQVPAEHTGKLNDIRQQIAALHHEIAALREMTPVDAPALARRRTRAEEGIAQLPLPTMAPV